VTVVVEEGDIKGWQMRARH